MRQKIRGLTQQVRNPVSCDATVARVQDISPSYTRITLESPRLTEYAETHPADAVKLVIPAPPDDQGSWRHHADEPAVIRAFTTSGRDHDANTVSVDILDHGSSPTARWLQHVEPGHVIGFHAVRRGFAIGDGIDSHLLIADPSALPAVAAIIGAIPASHAIAAHLQLSHPVDTKLLPRHPGLTVHVAKESRVWQARMPITCHDANITPTTQFWVAGEADAVASVRADLRNIEVHGDRVYAAAYWKAGRDSTERDRRLAAGYESAMSAGVDLSDPQVHADLEQDADG